MTTGDYPEKELDYIRRTGDGMFENYNANPRWRVMNQTYIDGTAPVESPQCVHGYYSPEINCPHCGWKVREG